MKTKPKAAARKPRTPKAPSPDAEAALIRLLVDRRSGRLIIEDLFKCLATDLEGNLSQRKWQELHIDLTSMLLMVEAIAALDGKAVKP